MSRLPFPDYLRHLESESARFRTVLEATDAVMRHEVGSLAKVARRLADEGVNIEAIMPRTGAGSWSSPAARE